MKRIFSYTISAAYNNCTLISFLKESGYSSQVITHLKRTENGILLNKTWARVRDILHTDDILTITLEEKTSSENIVASPLPLHIVYEDEDLMVINKPADMPILHRAITTTHSPMQSLITMHKRRNLSLTAVSTAWIVIQPDF